MRLLLVLALLLASPAAAPSAAYAQANWLGIGLEQGLVTGFSASWPGISGGLCGAPPDGHGSNCVFIPTGKQITHVYGTETVKVGGVELLAAVVCGMGNDWRTVWEGQQKTAATLMVATPKLPADYHLVGDGYRACWLMWQAINGGPYTGSGGGMEWQLTFTAE